MDFNRASAICVAVILILIGVSVSLSAALYLSWLQAKEFELDKLYTSNARIIQRSRICFNEVNQTLDLLESIKMNSCTSEHINNMQDILFNKRCVNEIEYLEDNMIKCSSEENFNNHLHLDSNGFFTPIGASIIMNVATFVKQDSNFITVRRTNYALSVDADRLTDVITEPYIKVALVTDDGQVISTLNYTQSNPELIQKVIANPNLNEVSGSLVAVSRVPGFYYISSESLSYVFVQWRKSLTLFLPFGLIMSLIASGAVIWALKKRLSMLGELKLAIAHREIVVYYQPIIEFKTGFCVGAEALVRWQKPDGTMIRPDLFIPLAEDSGLIQPITDQVIESIVTDLKEILTTNRHLHIAINVAVVDFNSQRIFKQLDLMLPGTNIEPQQIWLEITERGFMDYEATRENLKQVRELGYTIVMDDFGTGYSSLAYLKELPIDVLKIDKSFVNTVATDSVTSHVTKYIIQIAKTLHLQIVAEGVETQAQADYLKAHNVEYAQGWLYAKAMPLKKFLVFCQHNTQRPR